MVRREHLGVQTCAIPPSTQYVVGDVWQCPECKQRYRLILTPVYGFRVWVKVSFLEALLGLG